MRYKDELLVVVARDKVGIDNFSTAATRSIGPSHFSLVGKWRIEDRSQSPVVNALHVLSDEQNVKYDLGKQ